MRCSGPSQLQSARLVATVAEWVVRPQEQRALLCKRNLNTDHGDGLTQAYGDSGRMVRSRPFGLRKRAVLLTNSESYRTMTTFAFRTRFTEAPDHVQRTAASRSGRNPRAPW